MQRPGHCIACHRAKERKRLAKNKGFDTYEKFVEHKGAKSLANKMLNKVLDITKREWFFKTRYINGTSITNPRPIDPPTKKYWSGKRYNGTAFDTEAERDEYILGWQEYRKWCAENREAIKRAKQDRLNKTKRERNNTPEKIAAREKHNEERKARTAQTEKERQRWKDVKKRKIGIDGKRLPWDFEVRLLESQEGRCFYCDTDVGDDFHLDHVVPIAKGGTHHPENLVIACPKCNTTKRDLMPWEFSHQNLLHPSKNATNFVTA